jgi:hypothetical protein
LKSEWIHLPARNSSLVADGLLQIQILKEWFAKKFGRKCYLLPA